MILFHFNIMLIQKMTQDNTLNVKLSNLQLDKLKSVIENRTRVTLNLSSNIIGDSNDENNCPNKLLLTDTHKFQGFVKLLQLILRLIQNYQKLNYLKQDIIENVLKPLAKSDLMLLGLTAAASATDAAIN